MSASVPHLEWLQAELWRLLGLRGWIWINLRRGNGIGCLAYAKHDSFKLLPWLYPDPEVPCLLRKRAIWDDYVARHPSDIGKTPSNIYA